MARRPEQAAFGLTETYQLSKPTAVYSSGYKATLQYLSIIYGFIFIISLVWISCAHGFKPTSTNVVIYSMFIAMHLAMFLFLFLILVLPGYLARNFSIYVCSDGLIYKKEQEMIAVQWDQIERSDLGSLLLKDGTTLEFNQRIDGLRALQNNIKRKMRRSRQPLPRQLA